MCLAVPGQVISIDGTDPSKLTGQVRFGGVVKQVSLALLPDVKSGDYVMVHVGMALAKVNTEEAKKIIADIDLVNKMG